jgi:hypothetical protein
MADPCLANTNTAHPSVDGSGNLIVDVQLEPLNEGSLEADTNGIGVTVQSTGGLQHTASGMGMKVTSQGLHVGAEGLMKVNGFGRDGFPGPLNATNPNVAIARGSLVQYGSTLTLSGQLPSNELQSYVVAHASWRGRWTTNLTSFGGQQLDSIFAYLQLQGDGGGWITYDQASLEYADMSGSFALDTWFPFAMSNGTSHTLQARLLIGGGTTTGSNPQGTLYTQYGGTLEWIY